MIQVHATNHDGEGAGGCVGCRQDKSVPDIGFAFQPIVDFEKKNIFAFEALVRGAAGESARHVLDQIDDANQYAFDQLCRRVAIQSAAEIGIDTFLSINFLPNAVYRPEVCIRTTLEAAEQYHFPLNRIIFETVESERLDDNARMVDIFRSYKDFGFLTAIDDFGAGYSGLTLLTEFQPDIIKIDMALIQGIDTNKVKQSVVKGILLICRDLGIRCIAEGVETLAERDFLRDQGVALMQGFLFARPAFRSMTQVESVSFD